MSPESATDFASKAVSPISSSDIAIITPTMGRHKQLRRLLETLSESTTHPGQIIIADGGRDAETLVAAFSSLLPVSWLDCPNPGQVIQRNLALQQLLPTARIVIFFDDDIQLSPEALANFVTFWNSHETPPAGVSFNLTNMPKQPNNWFREFFLMASRPYGRVLKSGYNTPVLGVSESIESQWLIGGATAWRRDIFLKHFNPDLPSRWAITEDLMFSYKIHKTGEKLFVCADAKAEHIDDTIAETFANRSFRGRAAVLWRFMFVLEHTELSKTAFFWMIFGQIIGYTLRAFKGGLSGQMSQLGYAWGNIRGVLSCLQSMITRRDIRAFIE